MDVDVDLDVSLPADCTLESGGTLHTVTDVTSTPVTVDELFTVNCTAPSTHNFTASNESPPPTRPS